MFTDVKRTFTDAKHTFTVVEHTFSDAEHRCCRGKNVSIWYIGRDRYTLLFPYCVL